MSSPNEPGHSRDADGPGAGGTGNVSPGPGRPPGTGRGAAGDAPPWQRGGNRPPQNGPGDDRTEGPRGGTTTSHSPGADAARLNRFISGAPGGRDKPVREQPPRDQPVRDQPREQSPREESRVAERDRGETPRQDARPDSRPDARPAERTESYASELPDLSGPRGARKPGERQPDSARAAAATRPPAARAQGPLRASMQVRRFDPWSVLKVSLVLSVSLFFVWMIAVALLYLVLGAMGVWSKLNSNVGDLLTSAGGSSGGELVSSGTIFGGAALIGLINIVLLTAMATCGALIYNLTTDLVGGIEVTLADRD